MTDLATLTREMREGSDNPLPCPCCGGEAKFDRGFDAYRMTCVNGCLDIYQRKEDAIRAWNRRALLDAYEAAIAERDALAKTLDPGSDPALISRIIMRSIENGVRAEAAESALTAAQASAARMREALKPFAKAGELFGPKFHPDYDQLIYGPAAGPEYNITGDHLRAARSALAEEARSDG